MPNSKCLILSTAGNQEEAQRIAELLVRGHLAACVQITPISSTYWWQEKVMMEAEYLLLIKTSSDRYLEAEKAIQSIHSYEVPEIIQIPISNGLGRYLHWIEENTRPGK